ncbi:hypothetical protein F5Y04DRAFT_284532 [Hypomontagnella monticulosa]|nr:hypothetical protein F5Y04DRAFT_284532 [Hypomontagnella monticulosa]
MSTYSLRHARRYGFRISAAYQAIKPSHPRSTSWIAWEQPNPALYAPPPHGPPTSETQGAASKSQDTRDVGESVTAPATTVVAGGIQEVSTSGKTVPSSIQAGSSRAPYSQTRSMQTYPRITFALPTTLICIPGVTATWPGEAPTRPQQPRIRTRKLRTVHKNGGPDRECALQPELLETLKRCEAQHLAFALKEGGVCPGIIFGVAVKKYMDGVRARAEAEEKEKEKEKEKQKREEGPTYAELYPFHYDIDW